MAIDSQSFWIGWFIGAAAMQMSVHFVAWLRKK